MNARAPLARVLAATLLLGSGVARALDASARIEPSYQNGSTTTTDSTGKATRTDYTGWLQQYSLNLEERVFPALRLLGYGFYESGIFLGRTDGSPVETEAQRWTGSVRAVVGDPVLNGTLGYDRSSRSADLLAGGTAFLGPDLVRQTWSLLGSWRPEELPQLAIRLSRSDLFDQPRVGTDQTTDEANVGAVYSYRGLEARYRLNWQDVADHLAQTEAASLANGLRLAYSDRLLDDRVSVYGSYEIVDRQTETRATGTGGTVSTQQFPVAGLSIVEAFPATPDRVVLQPNGALIDGDVLGGAGLNLGFGPSLAGDEAYRDAGVQFPDVVTPVNAIWVWVDRPLPGPVSGAILWTAYRSDDNLNWTPVPLAGLVAFAPLNNRFEIPIAQTQARYLKVVARPLAAAVTTDARYRDILVTEMQVYQVVPAAQARGRTSNLRGDANASVRVRILRSVPLSYDFGGTLSHDSSRAAVRYSLANGLSISTPLTGSLTLDARAERTDFDAGVGHESLSRATAALGVQPLPVVGASLAYTGQISQTTLGNEWAHNLALFGRAQPYRGVTLNASGTYTSNAFADGASGRQWTGQVGLGLVPNGWLTLGGNWGRSSAQTWGGTRGNLIDRQARLEGTATLNPVPAIFASGSVARLTSNGPPYLLVNVNASVAPFPGGDLYLGFAYNETLDTRAALRVRGWGPSLRWKIRGNIYLDANYNVLDSTSPSQDIGQRVFTMHLSLTL
ncbi:MAG TPA: hypothetical protein VFR85_01660 [Anaeromyxobacteraceae bacterium]|nr:hypothetical protein [Anaeromyxobacteraceae bacterium]